MVGPYPLNMSMLQEKIGKTITGPYMIFKKLIHHIQYAKENVFIGTF